MAAGSSRRFGSNKLLYEWQGKYLYRCGLEALLEAARRLETAQEAVTCQVAVVSRYPQILEDVSGYGNVCGIYSPDSEKGASYTIRAALETKDTAQWYLFCAADQPFLQADTVESLVRETLRSGKGIGRVRSGEHTGNPVIFRACYRDALRALSGDEGGRKIIKAHPEDLYELEVCPDELLDADTSDFFDELVNDGN